MIRHYLTFAHQAAALDAELRGWVLAECWSQEKNILLLRFLRERTSRFVEVALDPRLGYMLAREDAARARRNTIDFFGGMIGVALVAITIDDGERVIRMHFADGAVLAFFFFGGGGGNAVLLRDGVVADAFMKYQGEYDRFLEPAHAEHLAAPEAIGPALRASADQPIRALMRAIPMLGRRLATEALYCAGLADATSLADAGDAQVDRLLEEVDRLYGACEASTRYPLYRLHDDAVLALMPLATLEREAVGVEYFESIADAIRAHRSAWHGVHAFAAARERIVRRLAGEQGRLERALANRLNAPEHEGRAAAWEHAAKLLMANMAAVPRGTDQAELVDWDGHPHTITLDPRLGAVENAERYFRRARGARDAATRAAGGVARNRAAIERIAGLLAQAQAATTVKALEAIENNNRDLFTMTAEAKAPGTAERFRRFEVAGGIEVYAGKNAANNDELTVRFARPNDYWLHARGTSGSHVVMRWNDTKTKPPKDALRQAASIAAYYSGARGAKMVPVAYTLKKHVRKPRGAAPGAVVMEREEVIMAEPRLPAGEEE